MTRTSYMDARASSEICVAHLVWAPLGPAPLRRFVESYNRHPAGVEHRLLILFNGLAADEPLDAWEWELAGIPHDALRMPRRMLDLDAYRHAVEQTSAERYCFLNSYSVLLADNWLLSLAEALGDADVGLAGATGSWASRSSHLRFGLHLGGPYAALLGSPQENSRLFRALASEGEARAGGRLGTMRAIPATLAGFPAFPAAHLRTNALLVERGVWTSLQLPELHSKLRSHLLESGRRSLTRQIEETGRKAVVVARDGTAYEAADWPQSKTFWQGDQQNLLVADNQTAAYQDGDARLREMLSRYAWGKSADPAVAAGSVA